MKLTTFKENLAKDLFNMTMEEALSKGICLECREQALSKCYSKAGRKEYRISGICEKCFDKIFNAV